MLLVVLIVGKGFCRSSANNSVEIYEPHTFYLQIVDLYLQLFI